MALLFLWGRCVSVVVRWGWLGIWVCLIAFSWEHFPEAHPGKSNYIIFAK